MRTLTFRRGLEGVVDGGFDGGCSIGGMLAMDVCVCLVVLLLL